MVLNIDKKDLKEKKTNKNAHLPQNLTNVCRMEDTTPFPGRIPLLERSAAKLLGFKLVWRA